MTLIRDASSYLKAPLEAYHEEVCNLFDPLPWDNKVLDVVKRIFITLIIPLAYILLAIPYGIGAALSCCDSGDSSPYYGYTPVGVVDYNPYKAPLAPIGIADYNPYKTLSAPIIYTPLPLEDDFHNLVRRPEREVIAEGQDLERGIAQLEGSGEPWWKDGAVSLIRKARFDSHEDEYVRLWTAGLLNPEEDAKIDAALGKISLGVVGARTGRATLAVKVLLGQAMEIRRVFSATHHVFIHAQTTNWMTFTYLLKEMAKKSSPGLNLTHFKYLRVPTPERIRAMDARYYDNSDNVSDNDMQTRTDILSADAYYYNTQSHESALYFLANNSNIMADVNTLTSVIKLGIRFFYPNISDSQALNYAASVAAIPIGRAASGNLFVICTPRDRAEEFQYRSHPFGRACKCHPKERASEIVDSLVVGILDETTRCTGGIAPQFRVYSPHLAPTPNREHRTYLLTPFPKAVRKGLKASIKRIVAAIHQSSNPAVA